MPRLLAICVVGLALTLPAPVRAQQRIADGLSSLPGVLALPTALPAPSLIGLSADGAYGFTESVLRTSDAHHRLGARIAASVRPIRWVGLGMQLAMRYDAHTFSAGSDDGAVFDGSVFLRGAVPIGRAFHLGLHASMWVPSQPSATALPRGLSFETLMVGTVAPPNSRVAFSPIVGFRIDRSAEAAPDLGQISPNDRVALGFSSFHAVIAAMGVSIRASDVVDVLAEWRWDLLLGGPAVTEGPHHLRAGVGIRPAGGGLRFILAADACLCARPANAAGPPLVPIDPRVGFTFAIQWQSNPIVAPPSSADDAQPESRRRAATPPRATARARPRRSGAPTGIIDGSVDDDDDRPLPGVIVRRTGPDGNHETTTDDRGRYRFERLPDGTHHITLELYGRRTVERDVEVTGDATAHVDDTMAADRSRGQIRGTVRGADSVHLDATVRISGRSRERHTGPGGEFRLDVAPGRHTVIVAAPGYETQRRNVNVEPNGVTILNVDLRQTGR